MLPIISKAYMLAREDGSDRIAKASLWTATVIIAVALVFPYMAPLFIET